MAENRYLEALKRIPRGETRSFLEIAALAGRPGAARAAGRAVALCPIDSPYPWHRVVSANGKPKADPGRERLQWLRLRREGARPRGKESVLDWASRTSAVCVGHYPTREYVVAADERVENFKAGQVERFSSEAEARARGFSRVGEGPPRSEPLPSPRSIGKDSSPVSSLDERLSALDWRAARIDLAARGYARFPALLAPAECASILAESSRESRFDRSVDMLPRGFGVGSYHYYSEPIPAPAASLRDRLFRELVPVARELWPKAAFPETLEAFWRRCRSEGQRRSSSILICYGEGGINHPHRDIYGTVWFPFQALLMLSKRGRDFEGGEFVLHDEVDGASPVEIPVSEGDVVAFVSRERIQSSRRRPLRIGVRHGMRTVVRGNRYGLGIVFHLAE
jgi:alkylated DNA nucleotide flippase Atl1